MSNEKNNGGSSLSLRGTVILVLIAFIIKYPLVSIALIMIIIYIVIALRKRKKEQALEAKRYKEISSSEKRNNEIETSVSAKPQVHQEPTVYVSSLPNREPVVHKCPSCGSNSFDNKGKCEYCQTHMAF